MRIFPVQPSVPPPAPLLPWPGWGCWGRGCPRSIGAVGWRARAGVSKWGEDWVLRGSPLAWGGCPGWVPPRLQPLPTRRGIWLQRPALLPGISIPQPCSCLCRFTLIFISFKQIPAIYLNNWFSSRRTRGAVGNGAQGAGGVCAPSRGILPSPSNWLGLAFPSPAPPRALLAHLAPSSYLLVHIFQALICLFCKAAALPRFDLPMISRALLCKGLIWCPGCRLSSLV